MKRIAKKMQKEQANALKLAEYSQPKDADAGSARGELGEDAAAAAQSTTRLPMNLKRQRVSGCNPSFANNNVKKCPKTLIASLSEVPATEADHQDLRGSQDERLPASGCKDSFSICNITLGKRKR